jgi:hypothetical protein
LNLTDPQLFWHIYFVYAEAPALVERLIDAEASALVERLIVLRPPPLSRGLSTLKGPPLSNGLSHPAFARSGALIKNKLNGMINWRNLTDFI